MTPKMRGGKFVICSVRGCEHPVEESALADLCPFHIKPIWPVEEKVLGETKNTRLICNGDTHRAVDKATGADYRISDCDCAIRSKTQGE